LDTIKSNKSANANWFLTDDGRHTVNPPEKGPDPTPMPVQDQSNTLVTKDNLQDFDNFWGYSGNILPDLPTTYPCCDVTDPDVFTDSKQLFDNLQPLSPSLNPDDVIGSMFDDVAPSSSPPSDIVNVVDNEGDFLNTIATIEVLQSPDPLITSSTPDQPTSVTSSGDEESQPHTSYARKRRRNNEACRESRRKKKKEKMKMEEMVDDLIQSNEDLKKKIKELEAERDKVWKILTTTINSKTS